MQQQSIDQKNCSLDNPVLFSTLDKYLLNVTYNIHL